jgi:hypothetical protein
MEEFIKYLTGDLVARLEELEQETDFEFLMTMSSDDISSEAQLLYEEINKLKSRLQEL